MKSTKLQLKVCPICDAEEIYSGQRKWHYICKKCKYEFSNLSPVINKLSSKNQLNEIKRLKALKKTRSVNFKLIHKTLQKYRPIGSNLLDIGAAHGWFLDEVEKSYVTSGIEPDIDFIQALKDSKHEIKIGFFPDVLSADEIFDIIVFNDVLEHIPDTNNVLSACHKHLSNDGILLINCPSSGGIFYLLSKVTSIFGITVLFDRMWQNNLPSPHLHYFNTKNLSFALNKNNFTVLETGFLNTIHMEGLYSRICYAGNIPIIFRIIIYLLVAVGIPVLKIMPKDIVYIVARKAC